MKQLTIVVVCLIIASGGYAQRRGYFYPKQKLDSLEAEIRKGSMPALMELGGYLDSQRVIPDNLGYHSFESKESSIARRIIKENCMFLKSELDLDAQITATEFLNFLKSGNDAIFFSDLADAFIITPFEDRPVKFEITGLTEVRKQQVEHKEKEILNYSWAKNNGIDTLIEARNPQALLQTASLLLKGRNRWNEHQWNESEYIDLLQFLTRTNIAVPNEHGEMSTHIGKVYNPESKINLLIYFARNYTNYNWNEQKSIFINAALNITVPVMERGLFEQLNDSNRAIAMNAFIALSNSNPEKVRLLAQEYDKYGLEYNYILPFSPYKVLIQLTVFTDYCRRNNINIESSEEIHKIDQGFKGGGKLFERYLMEDKIAANLDFEQITALEYWSIVYSKSYWVPYSTARIVDKFYSENWKQLISNDKYLKCYLKKSTLFRQLHLGGVCKYYLRKFINSSEDVLLKIKSLQTDDPDIKEQIEEIVKLNQEHLVYKEKNKEEWDGNKRDSIKNLDERLKEIITDIEDTSKTQRELENLLSRISYDQIDTAISGISSFPFRWESQKYRFLETDFGFFNVNFNDTNKRNDFLNNYHGMNEYQMYAYCLEKAGIHFRRNDGDLNYDEIYEMLKYDLVSTFTGGGWGGLSHVYSLIKLLELTFSTTLGFPDKLCNSQGVYYCTQDDRARTWMNYLEKNNLLEKMHDEPISFTYRFE